MISITLNHHKKIFFLYLERRPFEFCFRVSKLKPLSSRRHGYLHEFGSDQPEASLLKTLDDLTAQSSLDAIGLHGNEGTLHVY